MYVAYYIHINRHVYYLCLWFERIFVSSMVIVVCNRMDPTSIQTLVASVPATTAAHSASLGSWMSLRSGVELV